MKEHFLKLIQDIKWFDMWIDDQFKWSIFIFIIWKIWKSLQIVRINEKNCNTAVYNFFFFFFFAHPWHMEIPRPAATVNFATTAPDP